MDKLIIFLFALIALSSCGGLDDLDKTDEQIYQEEVKQIDAWLLKKGLTAETTTYGLRYIIKENAGFAKAANGDSITVHYTGKFLSNEQTFDSSIGKTPFTFVLGSNRVIQGWEEGFRLLGKGDKATLILPSKLAYGRFGAGSIPPNTVIFFDVEVINVK